MCLSGDFVLYSDNERYLLHIVHVQLASQISWNMMQHGWLRRRQVVQPAIALLYPRQEGCINVSPYLLEALGQLRLRSRGELMPDSQQCSPAVRKRKPVMVSRVG